MTQEQRVYLRNWQRRNPDKVRQYRKKWMQSEENRTRWKAYAAHYRVIHQNGINKYHRALYWSNPQVARLRGQQYYLLNRKKVLQRCKKNYLKSDVRQRKIFTLLRRRCNDPRFQPYRYYGAKGIKNRLNFRQFVFLWNRDKADTLVIPTLDRIDGKGNYTLKNCRFIECSENSKKSWRERNASLSYLL